MKSLAGCLLFLSLIAGHPDDRSSVDTADAVEVWVFETDDRHRIHRRIVYRDRRLIDGRWYYCGRAVTEVAYYEHTGPDVRLWWFNERGLHRMDGPASVYLDFGLTGCKLHEHVHRNGRCCESRTRDVDYEEAHEYMREQGVEL